MKNIKIINNAIKNKWLLIFALTSFSFIYSLYDNLFMSPIVVFILSYIFLTYLNKEKYIFESSRYEYLTHIIAIPIILYDGLIFYGLIKQYFPIAILVYFLAMYAVVITSYVIAVWLSNRIGDIIMSFDKIELVVFIIGWCILSIFTVLAYYNSAVFGFSNEKRVWDVFFRSDSGLFKDAFYNLWHPENDLRQCLFAVFSKPIWIYAKIISELTSIDICCIICLIQNFLLMLFFFMLSRMISGKHKNIFTTILPLTFLFMFPSLFYAIILEQYVIACFFLILFVYDYIYRENSSCYSLEYAVATSTLLTSGAFISIMSGETMKEKLQTFIKHTVNNLFMFVFLFALYGRFTLFTALNIEIDDLLDACSIGNPTSGVTFINKVQQYFAFVKHCFILPFSDIAIIQDRMNIIPISTIDVLGVALFCVSMFGLISGVFNVDKRKISIISLYWLCISIFCMIIVGWGSVENCFILYSLYFGWVFWIGIIQSIQMISSKHLAFTIYSVLIIVVTVLNTNTVLELFNFAKIFYPR